MGAKARIVDCHVHLWDLLHPTLRWDWLAPEAVHPILGDINAIKSVAYKADALWAEARFAGVEAFVHVQAAIGSPDPVEETRWLTAMAGDGGVPTVAIAHADLGDGSAERVMEGHAESPLFRGIRDFGAERYIASGGLGERYEASLRYLARNQLVFDLDCEHQNMEGALALARRHPGLQVVLEHIGYPRRRDTDYFAAWSRAIGLLGQAGNVTCKISGVAMTDRSFTRGSLAPWVERCLEVFGPGRCVIGSNWPIDRLASSYDVIMSYYRDAVSPLGPDEQAAILSANAERIYRLPQTAGRPGRAGPEG